MKKLLLTILSIATLLLPSTSFALTATFYSAAGANSPVDGYVEKAVVTTNWATVRDGTAGSAPATPATNANLYIFSYSNKYSGNIAIGRAFMLFDTSALTADATISAGTLSLYLNTVGDADNDAQGYAVITSSTPASNANVVLEDYDQLGTTALSNTIDLTGLATGQYHDFTLNAAGIAHINKTGVSNFGAREGHDMENSQIGDTLENDFLASSADVAGTSQDPKLVVTYTIPATARHKNPMVITPN